MKSRIILVEDQCKGKQAITAKVFASATNFADQGIPSTIHASPTHPLKREKLCNIRIDGRASYDRVFLQGECVGGFRPSADQDSDLPGPDSDAVRMRRD
jgi:hypothetical protein